MLRSYPRVTLGGDPEFFFELPNGAVVGSEKIIPPEGLKPDYGAIKRDGVQGEIQLVPAACRATIYTYLHASFKVLAAALRGTPWRISKRMLVEVTTEELETLHPDSRTLGCMPSFNCYMPGAGLGVDGATYRMRSAGGHIHLGLTSCVPPRFLEKDADGQLKDPSLVQALDIIVGNTCVLLDRDEGQVERRRVYGRAGEYRLPKHGLEYRTLSNFWLRSWPLTAMVLGLARQAMTPFYEELYWKTKMGSAEAREPEYWKKVYLRPGSGYENMTHNGMPYWEYQWKTFLAQHPVPPDMPKTFNAPERLISRFDLEKVATAINQNDFDLAMENFRVLLKWVEEELQPFDNNGSHGPNLDYSNWTLDPTYTREFLHVIERGIEAYWPQDALTWWSSNPITNSHRGGWESFLHNVVRAELEEKVGG